MDAGSERSQHQWNIHRDIHVKEFNNNYYSLVKMVHNISSTFQDIYFDGSLLPLFIT